MGSDSVKEQHGWWGSEVNQNLQQSKRLATVVVKVDKKMKKVREHCLILRTVSDVFKSGQYRTSPRSSQSATSLKCSISIHVVFPDFIESSSA